MRRKFPTPCRRADQAATLRIVALGIPVPRQQRIQLIDLGASGHDALENISEIARRVDVVDLCVVHERRENGPSLGAAFAAGEQMVFLSYPIGLMLRSMPSISTRPSSMKLLGLSQCSGCSGSCKADFLRDFRRPCAEPKGLKPSISGLRSDCRNRSSLRRRQPPMRSALA
jgi:hypothetical protein